MVARYTPQVTKLVPKVDESEGGGGADPCTVIPLCYHIQLGAMFH